MNHFEVDDCLRSMVILVDTREQDTKTGEGAVRPLPRDYVRQALSYGDYAYNFVLPDGKRFLEYSSHEVISPIVVERKMNLDELAGCFTRSRKRFEAEFARAKENGARIYLLVKCHLGEAFGREVSQPVQSCCLSSFHPCMAEPL